MIKNNSDFLVIGSGIAGLCFAINASRYGTVSVITKKQDSESNTNYAQGGIACVIDPSDSFEKHIFDTLACGHGLCNEKAVRILVEEGPSRIKELIDWGVDFSRVPQAKNDYRLHLGNEGGHSVNRIVHARDLTGKAVEEKLLDIVRASKNIRLYEHHCAVELITDHHLPRQQGKIVHSYGAYVLDTITRTIFTLQSKIPSLHPVVQARYISIRRTPPSPPETGSPWPIAPAR